MNDQSYLERRDYFLDGDRDGFSPNDGDCNDDDPMVHPDADEICDLIDNNCDGLLDEDPVLGDEWYVDLDGDNCFDDLIVTCDPPTEQARETEDDCD